MTVVQPGAHLFAYWSSMLEPTACSAPPKVAPHQLPFQQCDTGSSQAHETSAVEATELPANLILEAKLRARLDAVKALLESRCDALEAQVAQLREDRITASIASERHADSAPQTEVQSSRTVESIKEVASLPGSKGDCPLDGDMEQAESPEDFQSRVVSGAIAEACTALTQWWHSEVVRLDAADAKTLARMGELEDNLRSANFRFDAIATQSHSQDSVVDGSSGGAMPPDGTGSALQAANMDAQTLAKLTEWMQSLDGHVSSLRTGLAGAMVDWQSTGDALRRDLDELRQEKSDKVACQRQFGSLQARVEMLQAHVKDDEQTGQGIAGSVEELRGALEGLSLAFAAEREERQRSQQAIAERCHELSVQAFSQQGLPDGSSPSAGPVDAEQSFPGMGHTPMLAAEAALSAEAPTAAGFTLRPLVADSRRTPAASPNGRQQGMLSPINEGHAGRVGSPPSPARRPSPPAEGRMMQGRMVRSDSAPKVSLASAQRCVSPPARQPVSSPSAAQPTAGGTGASNATAPAGVVSDQERDQFMAEIRRLRGMNTSLCEEIGVLDKTLRQIQQQPKQQPQAQQSPQTTDASAKAGYPAVAHPDPALLPAPGSVSTAAAGPPTAGDHTPGLPCGHPALHQVRPMVAVQLPGAPQASGSGHALKPPPNAQLVHPHPSPQASPSQPQRGPHANKVSGPPQVARAGAVHPRATLPSKLPTHGVLQRHPL